MNLVTPSPEKLMKLSEELGDLLEESLALLWIATHDPECFDSTVAWKASLDLKARARAAIDAAFCDK